MVGTTIKRLKNWFGGPIFFEWAKGKTKGEVTEMEKNQVEMSDKGKEEELIQARKEIIVKGFQRGWKRPKKKEKKSINR